MGQLTATEIGPAVRRPHIHVITYFYRKPRSWLETRLFLAWRRAALNDAAYGGARFSLSDH
jgi:hypothetical protein